MPIINNLKSSKGSTAVYVTIVILSMLIILLTLFFISNSVRQNQLATAMKIKETYEVDNEKAADIYKALSTSDVTAYVEDGLILHYDAINNTGVGHSETTTTWKDLSGNNNDATVTGGTWTDDYLNFSKSNDTNGVKTNSNFSINFNAITFNIVFSLSNVNDVEALLGARTTSSNGMMLFNFNENDGLTLDTVGGSTRIKVGNRLSANQNYDLTLSFSNGTLRTYLNGKLESTMNYTSGNLTSFPLTIFTAGERSNCLGNIYSVKVYNRSLTEDEIKQNNKMDNIRFDLSSTVKQGYVSNGLMLHYDAVNNTGSGHSTTTTTWKDLSGNNRDATVTGGTWGDNYLRFTTSNTSNGVKTKSNFPINYSNMTFSIVFNLTQVSSVEALLGSRTTSSNGMMLFNFDENNALTLDTVGGSTRVDIGSRLKVDNNYEITVALSNGTMRLYVNGVLTNTTKCTVGNTNFPLTVFTAGQRSNSLGNIYNVKVYNRALTDEEVKQNYNKNKADYDLNSIYVEDFTSSKGYTMSNTTSSYSDGIITLKSSAYDPNIFMNYVTSFSPLEYRYIEVRYKSNLNVTMEFFMIENPSNQTYSIIQLLEGDNKWHTVTFDLWSNTNVKNREKITGWRWDWTPSPNATMQVDYIKIRK